MVFPRRAPVVAKSLISEFDLFERKEDSRGPFPKSYLRDTL